MSILNINVDGHLNLVRSSVLFTTAAVAEDGLAFGGATLGGSSRPDTLLGVLLGPPLPVLPPFPPFPATFLVLLGPPLPPLSPLPDTLLGLLREDILLFNK